MKNHKYLIERGKEACKNQDIKESVERLLNKLEMKILVKILNEFRQKTE